MMRTIFFYAAAASLAGGCATVPNDSARPAFADVAKTVETRTAQRIEWHRTTADDAAATDAIRALLARELDADSAVQVALLNNRRLQATYEDLGVAQADLVQAGLLKNPVFSGDFKFDTHGGGTKVELAVVENFLDVFLIPLRRRVAADRFGIVKNQVAGAVIDLACKTRAAFYEQAATEQTLALRRTATEAAAASFDFASRLHKAGNTSEFTFETDRATYEQAKLDLARAEAAALDTRERLDVMLGVWGNDTTWKTPGRLPDLPATADDTTDVERRAVSSSLDLAVAGGAVEASARTLGIRRSFGLIPEADFGAAAERETAGGWGVGPAFSVPIPLVDQGQAATAGAWSRLRRAREEFYATAVEVRSAARVARNRLVAARATADYTARVIVPLRRQITEQAQLYYNGMFIGAPQLLQSKQAQTEAGIAAVDALRDYWLARTAFDGVIAGRMSDSLSRVPTEEGWGEGLP